MSWTRMSTKQHLKGRSRLRFERLEDPSLLAVDAFTINLYDDASGRPGEPITNATMTCDVPNPTTDATSSLRLSMEVVTLEIEDTRHTIVADWSYSA